MQRLACAFFHESRNVWWTMQDWWVEKLSYMRTAKTVRRFVSGDVLPDKLKYFHTIKSFPISFSFRCRGTSCFAPSAIQSSGSCLSQFVLITLTFCVPHFHNFSIPHFFAHLPDVPSKMSSFNINFGNPFRTVSVNIADHNFPLDPPLSSNLKRPNTTRPLGERPPKKGKPFDTVPGKPYVLVLIDGDGYLVSYERP